MHKALVCHKTEQLAQQNGGLHSSDSTLRILTHSFFNACKKEEVQIVLVTLAWYERKAVKVCDQPVKTVILSKNSAMRNNKQEAIYTAGNILKVPLLFWRSTTAPISFHQIRRAVRHSGMHKTT